MTSRWRASTWRRATSPATSPGRSSPCRAGWRGACCTAPTRSTRGRRRHRLHHGLEPPAEAGVAEEPRRLVVQPPADPDPDLDVFRDQVVRPGAEEVLGELSLLAR